MAKIFRGEKRILFSKLRHCLWHAYTQCFCCDASVLKAKKQFVSEYIWLIFEICLSYIGATTSVLVL